MAYVLRHFSESNPKVQKTTMEPAVQVGFYDPGGTWNYESTYEYPNLKDRENAEKRAVERCNYLNGGLPDGSHDTLHAITKSLDNIAKSLERFHEDQERILDVLDAIKDIKRSIF